LDLSSPVIIAGTLRAAAVRSMAQEVVAHGMSQ
jgi:hypothetical protein